MDICIVLLLFNILGSATSLNGPRQTFRNIDLDPRGWSPRPTPAPEIRPYRNLLKRGLTNTCAWLQGAPLTCSPNQYCAYNAELQYMDCCSVYDNGQFSGCYHRTSCVNQAESSSLCPNHASSCFFDSSTGIWYEILLPSVMIRADFFYSGASGPSYAYCVTAVLYKSGNTFTTLRCGSSSEFLTASTAYSSEIITSSTTPISTPENSPTIVSSTSTTSSLNGLSSPTLNEQFGGDVSFTSTTTSPITSTTTSLNGLSSPTVNEQFGGDVSSPTPEPKQGFNTGTIVGGAVGGVAGLLLIGGIIGFLVYRMRVKKREAEYMNNTPEKSATIVPSVGEPAWARHELGTDSARPGLEPGELP